MRNQQLVVGVASPLASDNARAQKRASIRDALAAGEDVTLLEGVTSLAIIDTTQPDEHLHDLILRLLEANQARIGRGQLHDVATDLVWAIEHAGYTR